MIKRIKSIVKDISTGTNLKAKIGRGVFWSFIGTLISKGFGVIGYIIIARILTVDDYGKLGIIRSVIATFTILSIASFGTTSTKYIALYLLRNKYRVANIVGMTRLFVFIIAFIISVLIYIFSSQIAISVLNDPNLVFAVKLTAPITFFTAMNGLQNGILSGFEKFKYIANVNMVNGLIGIPILIFASYLYGLKGTFIGLSINIFLLWSSSFYLVMKTLKEFNIKPSLKGIRKEMFIIKEFTIPSFLSGIIVTPIILICNLILTKTENGYEELGIYTAAFNFSIITSTLDGIIGQVLYPYAMKLFKKENRKFDFFNILLPFSIGIAINLPIIIFPELITLLYGAKYHNEKMWYSLVFISMTTIIMSFKTGIARNFAAGNYMWFSLFSNFLWGMFAILGVSLFIEYGSIGRALGFLVAYLITNLIFIPFYLKKELIDRKLFLSINNMVTWMIIVVAFLIFILITSILAKIIAFGALILFSVIFMKRWYYNYTKLTI